MKNGISLPENVSAFLAASPAEKNSWEKLCALGSGGTAEKYLAGLSRQGLEAFFSELEQVDFAWLESHRRALLGREDPQEESEFAPIEAPHEEASGEELARLGQAAVAAGEVAVAVFAGGAASRFFGADAGAIDGSAGIVKGLCPATPVAGFSFLERFAFELLEEGMRAGRLPVWILMTSPVTDEAIRAWLRRAALRGFAKERVMVLCQGANPRLDMDGDLVASPDGRLLWTGNGHGGIFAELLRREDGGARPVDRLRSLGVRHLLLHNVDNLCARPLWPARLGFHVRAGHDMTLSAVARDDPKEKLGIFARRARDGVIEVLEYSVCPQAIACREAHGGSLAFRLGHINTNIVRLDAVRADIPPTLYRNKRVSAGGRSFETSTFEMLNQGLASLLEPERVGVFEVGREFFRPTKSIKGEDSLEETRAHLCRVDARRLSALFARVDASALVELDPALGLEGSARTNDAQALRGAGRNWRLDAWARVFLGVRHGPVSEAPPYGENLVVGKGATFWVEAEAPYGRVRCSQDGRVVEDPATAGKILLGRGAYVSPGSFVRIRIQGDGKALVPDGARLSGNIDLVVPAGETVTLGG